MKLKELTLAIQRLLPLPHDAVQVRAPRPAEIPGSAGPAVIFVVDDDDSIRGAIRAVLEDDGRLVEDFATCEGFLEAYPARARGLPGDRRLSARNEWPRACWGGSMRPAIACRQS